MALRREDEVPPQVGNYLDAASVSLAERIARWTAGGQTVNAIPDLALRRGEAPTLPASTTMAPSLCVIAQGVKRVVLGEEVYVYDAHHFLLTSVDLPVVAHILEANPGKPYLGLILKLDLRAVAQLMVDSHLPHPRIQPSSRGIAVSDLSLPMLNAFQRLLDLLDSPEDIPILAPLIQREILYRLLVSEQGPRLRQMATVGSQSHQIARAIDWLKTNYRQPLRVDDLAEFAQMSTSALHHHFRALTNMSPLQFQKWLRLHEARQLMLTERLDAASAAFLVGYESPSQFSREYSRLFGAPPLRDITSLRSVTVNG